MKNYYAIIPATVRYDKKIPANAKLLYGELTALCNEKGFCWATNSYFAKLYETSERTIQRWLNALKEAGYITISIQSEDESSVRHIYICDSPRTKMSRGGDKNVTHNNTDNNTDNITENIYIGGVTSDDTPNNKQTKKSKAKRKRFTPPKLEEVEEYIATKSYNVDPERFFVFYDEADWYDTKGNKVRNWKQKVITWHNNSGATAKSRDNPPTPKKSIQEKLAENQRLIQQIQGGGTNATQ